MSWDQLYAFAQTTPLLSAIFVVLTAAVILTEIKRRISGIASVSPAQATILINRDDALVVDVSPAADFAKSHILGSVSAPLADLDPDKHKQLSKAKERPVVLVCRSGQSAYGAAKRLKLAGFAKVSVLDGGIAGWKAADLPLGKGR
jgi:rhodanese-related sulfurtransferase